MLYHINETDFDSDEIAEYLAAFDILQACKIITEKTGCPLSLARDYYDQMLHDSGIEEPDQVKKIKSYLMAEYDEE